MTTPKDVHPAQALWGMPRRIRLDFAPNEDGRLRSDRAVDAVVVRTYRTPAPWHQLTAGLGHPLTPYYRTKPTDPEWLPAHPAAGAARLSRLGGPRRSAMPRRAASARPPVVRSVPAAKRLGRMAPRCVAARLCRRRLRHGQHEAARLRRERDAAAHRRAPSGSGGFRGGRPRPCPRLAREAAADPAPQRCARRSGTARRRVPMPVTVASRASASGTRPRAVPRDRRPASLTSPRADASGRGARSCTDHGERTRERWREALRRHVPSPSSTSSCRSTRSRSVTPSGWIAARRESASGLRLGKAGGRFYVELALPSPEAGQGQQGSPKRRALPDPAARARSRLVAATSSRPTSRRQPNPEGDRAALARLRRGASLAEAMAEEATLALYRRLGLRRSRSSPAAAGRVAVAMVLAHVRADAEPGDDGFRPAGRRAPSAVPSLEDQDSAQMKPLRFRRLLAAREDELSSPADAPARGAGRRPRINVGDLAAAILFWDDVGATIRPAGPSTTTPPAPRTRDAPRAATAEPAPLDRPPAEARP